MCELTRPTKARRCLREYRHIDVPLEELEEHIKQRQVEKERLQDEIEEALATTKQAYLF